MKTIANYSVSKALLEKYEHRAKKRFGQNFIIDPSVVRKIASLGKMAPMVLEIGPGLGALTQQLALRYPIVIAYEIDKHVISILQESLDDLDNIEIRLQDFLEADLSEFTQPFAVCANLPYYITTPILFRLLELPVVSMVLMVQKEIGDRLAAKPQTKMYSALTIQVQYYYDVKIAMKVSKASFYPQPGVDSIVIECLPKENKIKLDNEKAFFEFVKGCFKYRRKTLINNLKDMELDRDFESILNKLDIDLKIRADYLTFDDYVSLYEAVYA